MTSTRLDERLSHLAPTSPPDPVRFEAARAEVMRLVRAAPTSDDHGPGPEPDDGRIRVDVVVPIDAGRRARASRSRSIALAAAAIGVVGAVAGALVILPDRMEQVPQSAVAACRNHVERTAVPAELAGEVSWRTLAAESWSRADLMLFLTDDGRYAGFCSHVAGEPDSATSATAWSGIPPFDRAADEVLPLGYGSGGWMVVWGRAGADVTSVDVAADWTEGSHAGGLVAEARMTDDGYWSAFFDDTEIPPGAQITLSWRVADGTVRSEALDDLWEGDEAAIPADACMPGWTTNAAVPVLEDQRGRHAATMLVNADGTRLTACVQDAEPPFEPQLTTSGEVPAREPAADEVVPVVGGASGVTSALAGTAGKDVERVVATTTDGTAIEATLADGYWLAWSPDLARRYDADPWERATVTWYLTDGTEKSADVWP